MGKNTVIRLFIVFILVIILSITAFLIDINLVIENRAPMFSILKETYEDGGTKEYIGPGYKIFRYNKLDEGVKIKFGTLFLQYE